METPKRYHPALVTLHWLVVIVMLSAGLLSESGGNSPVNIHMRLGFILFVLMVIRVIVRFSTKRPAPLDAGNSFFNKIGELTHLGLYLATFFILGLGGLIAYNRNLFAYMADNTVQITRAGFLGDIHHLGFILAIGLVTLHVDAALYHQFDIKDNILARMWYGK